MPIFKPKPNKKIKFNKKSAITLDNKHKEFLNEFSKDDYDNIPKLKYEKQELLEKINNNKNDLSVEQQLEIKDRIKEIKKNIIEIRSRKKNIF